jgi:hypothetical protein
VKASTETITIRAAVSPRLWAALIRLESDLTFIEMEARMHYHNRRNWDMDLEFHYWARNV